MIDYSCLLTERFLQRALDDPAYLTMTAVRRDHLEGPASHGDLPVPFNQVMIATFYLTGMDIAHRLITWLDAVGIDWERAMVIFAGQAGRPTAGVTQESHSIAGVVRAVSRGRLARRAGVHRAARPRLPALRPGATATAPRPGPGGRLPPAVGRAARHLRPGGRHVRGLPALRRARPPSRPPSAPAPPASTAKPALKGPGDWFALVTRLRVVMEDPAQLLSGAVTDYASSELVAHANDPSAVTVPGLDGEPYPHITH